MFDEENQAGGILGYTQRLKSLGGTPGGIATTPQNTGIGGELTKSGPLTRAIAASGIAGIAQRPTVTEQQSNPADRGIMGGLHPTDPDTDGRRQYSPSYADAFANRGGSFAQSGPSNGPDSHVLDPVATGIAAPVQPGAVRGIAQLNPNERVGAVIGAADQGTAAVGRPEARQTVGTLGAANAGNAGIAAMPTGRNDPGVITADSAAAAMGNPMTRSGGIAGSYDGKGINEIMARENKARGEMIDSMIKANGGNGIAVLPDNNQQQQQQVPSISDLQSAMKSAGTRTERAAYGQALNQAISGQNQLAHEQMRQQGAMDQRGITAGIEKERMAGIDHRAADRNQVQVRGQDMTASTATDRIASQERIAEQRTQDAGTRLTLPQRRSNFEIDAARERIAGLSPEEIKRKTANYTATGRENPEYDPTLAKAVSLSNRRKYGADDHFDQREQAQQPAGTDGDMMTRFRGDKAMQGHKAGQMTDQGLEVFDASGRLVGHYR